MKLTLFFLIFCSIFCQAQNESIKETEIKQDTLKDVFHYAIFPGCEKYLENSKSHLPTCFVEKLNEKIGEVINPSMDRYSDKQNSKNKLEGRVYFRILKSGKLEFKSLNINDEGFEKEITPLVKELLETLIVEPGAMNGEPVNVSGIVPLKIVFN